MRKSGVNSPKPKTTGGGSNRGRGQGAGNLNLPSHNKTGGGTKGPGNGPKKGK